MIRFSIVALTVFLAGSGSVQAEEAGTTQPATRPTTTRAADPAVDRILDRLEARKVETIEAALIFRRTDTILDSTEKYEGILRFKMAEPSPRFFIRFDKFVQDGIVSRDKQWHVFDGQWYIEAREKTETIVKRQIARPGEEVDAFDLGKGPFPLPFGQKKAEILKHFTVELVKPEKKDPPDTDHLVCTPRPGTDLADRYDTIHFYVHRKLALPVCVRTVEKQEDILIEARFPSDKIKINEPIAPDKLKLPDLSGYEITEERL